MNRKLSRFVEHKHEIITEFKEYLANEEIVIAERWYTFMMFGNLLSSDFFYNNIFYSIYTKYHLYEDLRVVSEIQNEEYLQFVDLIELLRKLEYAPIVIDAIKNDLLKTGIQGVHKD